MEKISNSDELDLAIAALELKQTNEGLILKEQFIIVQESLRPANLIKRAFYNLVTSTELKHGVVDVSMGVTAGFLTKELLKGDSPNVLKKLLSSAAQSFVSAEVIKNGDRIRSWASSFFNKSEKDDGNN